MSQKEAMVATMVKKPVMSQPTSCAMKFEFDQSILGENMC